MSHNQLCISIIIPFYNEEFYLDRCILSVINQTSKNIEVILVNDGSTDSSLEIAKKFLKEHHFISLISIKNSGLSEARNTALKKCTGDYVTFLDADDTLKPNMVEIFTKKVLNHKDDLIICNFQLLSENGDKEIPTSWSDSFSSINFTKQLIPVFYKERITETVWAKLFSTKIAKQILFEKDRWFEDRPFFVEFLLKSETVSFIPEKLLNIYCRKSSISRRVLSTKRIADIYAVFELELALLKKYNANNSSIKGAFKTALSSFVDTYILQIIDQKNMTNLVEVRSLYLDFLKIFSIKILHENITFNLKDKIILNLLKMPNYIGWTLSNLVFKTLKKERIETVLKIKNL